MPARGEEEQQRQAEPGGGGRPCGQPGQDQQANGQLARGEGEPEGQRVGRHGTVQQPADRAAGRELPGLGGEALGSGAEPRRRQQLAGAGVHEGHAEEQPQRQECPGRHGRRQRAAVLSGCHAVSMPGGY
jgi:hypothetical protein